MKNLFLTKVKEAYAQGKTKALTYATLGGIALGALGSFNQQTFAQEGLTAPEAMGMGLSFFGVGKGNLGAVLSGNALMTAGAIRSSRPQVILPVQQSYTSSSIPSSQPSSSSDISLSSPNSLESKLDSSKLPGIVRIQDAIVFKAVPRDTNAEPYVLVFAARYQTEGAKGEIMYSSLYKEDETMTIADPCEVVFVAAVYNCLPDQEIKLKYYVKDKNSPLALWKTAGTTTETNPTVIAERITFQNGSRLNNQKVSVRYTINEGKSSQVDAVKTAGY